MNVWQGREIFPVRSLLFQTMQNISEVQQVFPEIQFFKDSGTFAPEMIYRSLPIWVGDFPSQLAELYPADKEVYFRQITLRVNDKWENVTLRQEKDPSPEGFTCKQGEPCYVIKNNRLHLVKWYQHTCALPHKKMTADDWDALFEIGED